MSTLFVLVGQLLLLLSLVSVCIGTGLRGHVAIANRGNASISLVNPNTLQAMHVTLPDNGEPMYFGGLTNPPQGRAEELWIGDRRNSRLVVYKRIGNMLKLDGFVPTPRGLFHSMVAESAVPQKIVTSCDIDNVTVVHDVLTRRELCKIVPPAQVAREGGRPHDATTDGEYAYVSYIGASGGGYVASYYSRTCDLISFVKTAADPHLAVRPGSRLWVAAQGGEVLSFETPYLTRLSIDASLPSPHGIFLSFDYKHVYVINIASGGKDAVHVFQQYTGKKLKCPQIDTTKIVPHNAALSFENSRLFITHSIRGKSYNSAWDIDMSTGCVIPQSEKIFKTGRTPFGICVC